MLTLPGDDGLTEFTLRTSKTFPAKSRADPKVLVEKTTGEEWKDRFRVYFPSERTVKESKGGPMNAGTICFQSKWYAGPKFPRHVLRDCISRRDGLLMHNKVGALILALLLNLHADHDSFFFLRCSSHDLKYRSSSLMGLPARRGHTSAARIYPRVRGMYTLVFFFQLF